jgi:hypothetical protein
MEHRLCINVAMQSSVRTYLWIIELVGSTMYTACRAYYRKVSMSLGAPVLDFQPPCFRIDISMSIYLNFPMKCL